MVAPKKPSLSGRTKTGAFAPGNALGKEVAARQPRSHYRRAVQQMCEKSAREAFEITLELAREKNEFALKWILDRAYPAPRSSTYVNQDAIKDVITQQDANNAMTTILNDVGASEIAIEEGEQLISLMTKKVESTQLCLQEQLNEIQMKISGLTAGNITYP